MGEQFWWIYDAALAGVVLVFAFVMGRKGMAKALISLVCTLLALVIAFSVSGAVSKGIYKTAMRPGAVKNLSKDLYSDSVKSRLAEYLSGLEYNLRIKNDKLTDIIENAEDLDSELYNYANNLNGTKVDEEGVFKNKLHEVYSQIIYDLVSKEFDPYIADHAKELVIDNPAPFAQIAKELNEEGGGQKEAAHIIADNYIGPTYSKVFRYISFIAVFVVVLLLAFFIMKSFTESLSSGGAVSHIMGGILGIGIGIIILIVAGVVIKLNILMGNNEMMLFNKDTLDSTVVFKYIFNLVSGL
jgi:preprotein translocase subunit SecF